MWKEFKTFINQGNAIDLAIGVIIGAAFGKIVNSMVNDIIMPVISRLTGRVDLQNRFIALDGGSYANLAAAKAASAPVVSYGVFINTVVEFFVVAFTIFLVVRQLNRYRNKDKPAA